MIKILLMLQWNEFKTGYSKIHIYVYICMYVCINVYVYTERGRQREKDRERDCTVLTISVQSFCSKLRVKTLTNRKRKIFWNLLEEQRGRKCGYFRRKWLISGMPSYGSSKNKLCNSIFTTLWHLLCLRLRRMLACRLISISLSLLSLGRACLLV